MSTQNITMLADPGHEWIVIHKEQLAELGIAGDISVYSYMSNNFAYLEGDCDAARLFDALDKRGIAWSVTCTEIPFDSRQNPRNMNRYRAA